MARSSINTMHTQQLVDGDAAVALRRRKLRLEVLKGPDKKLRREFEGDRLVIGTHERCDLALSDPTVSRQHCEIALVEDGYAIRDLDSTNGTFLQTTRIREIVVDREIKLRVGDTTLRLAPLDDTVEIPLSQTTRLGPLTGRSPAMRQVIALLAKVAPTNATVLITGESGTGKEVAARAVHEASSRAKKPFVVVDCGALPDNLIESELYGHARGAFTGAVKARVGAFEAANGGTIFLDELGELPLEMQTRLLGVLERKQVTPLGETQSRPVDVRVVAATNRDLRREINRGGFREDLYFRLAVVSVQMPPLRSRPEDIRLYVDHFLDELGTSDSFAVDDEAIAQLERQPWPGNVRELRNVLERAAVLGETAIPEVDDTALPTIASEVDISVPFKIGKAALIEQYEREYMERLLDAHDGNITQAARAAGIDRVHILRVLDRYGLRQNKQG